MELFTKSLGLTGGISVGVAVGVGVLVFGLLCCVCIACFGPPALLESLGGMPVDILLTPTPQR